MELRLLEESKGRAVVEVRGESQTMTTLIADAAVAEGKDAAAVQQHPFMAEPRIVVADSNPIKTLEKAAENVMEQLADFKKEFESASKK
jgi:DNA-directed RNA polymerase subunit L